MPPSSDSSILEKQCLACNSLIEIKTKRDIVRKKFCNRTCANKHTAQERIKNLDFKFCLGCGLKYKPTNFFQIYCKNTCTKSKQVERSYKWMNNNPKAYISHLLAKKERRHLNVSDILKIYEKQKGLCSLSKVPLTFIKIPNTKKVSTNLSLDRIDSNKGYEIDNIQLVCTIVNIMKSNLTMEEFKWWIIQLSNSQGED